MWVNERQAPVQVSDSNYIFGLLTTTALVGVMLVSPVHAADVPGASPVLLAQAAPAQGRVAFSIPAQSLGAALSQFGRQSGLQVTAPGGMTGGLQSPGVSGEMTPSEALTRLLTGTGLSWRQSDAQTIILVEAPKSGGAAVLPTLTVEGQQVPPHVQSGALPPAYAGGQVATGAQLGLLGNRSVMDTPFNQTSFTSQVIQDQQARKLDDVFANDPSVRPHAPRAYGFDFISVRGYPIDSTVYGINGLYGLSSGFSFNSMTSVERVELLKGPATLLNGMPAAGGVGGSANLVTKRATDEPITQLTTSFVSKSLPGAHIDIGRRYGETGEFGVRYNGAYRNGDTELAHQEQEQTTTSVGFDFRGERVRLSADIGYEKNNINTISRYVVLSGVASVPTAPDAEAKFSQPWTFWDSNGHMAMVQGEVDLTDSLTAYAQLGRTEGETMYKWSETTLTNLNGAYTGNTRLGRQEQDRFAAQTGFRSSFDTGFVHHLVNFNAATASTRTRNLNVQGANFTGNLYNPTVSANPVLSVGAPFKTGSSDLSSFGVANTMSVLDERVQLTIGVRKQYADTDSYTVNAQTGAYATDALSPGYGLVVKPWQNVSVYANHVQGLEPGSVVGPTFANAGQILPAYETEQTEAGVKVDWGRLTTTLSAFDVNKPLLITAPGNIQTQGGERRHRGVELNAFGEVTEGLRLLGGIMYVDAIQENTNNANNGKRMFGVSEVQANLGAEWDVPFVRGLTLTGRMIYSGEYYVNAANTKLAPDWKRYDVGARYALESPWNGKPIIIRFSVENVFDTNYWQGANTDQYVFLGAPRTFLLSSTFNF